jgi:hypothetical protein
LLKYMPYYGVNVTGPAVTVIPPESSVIVGVDPNVNVYVNLVVLLQIFLVLVVGVSFHILKYEL